MSYSIEDIKRDHDVITYAGNHGLNVVKEKDRTPSFIDPGDNKTCVVYYRDWWYDFKTRIGGDIIDLCAILNHNGDRGEAIRELGGGNFSWKKPTQNLNNQIALWHKNLKHRDYLHQRGITDETIDRLMIGENRGRIIIPYWKNDYVCNWIGRTLKEVTDKNPKYLKAKKEGIIQCGIPWGVHTIGRSDTLIITEGAFDALSFEQEGYSVLSPMGGWFSKQDLKTVKSAILSHKNTILLFDTDEAGQDFTRSLSEYLFRHQITRFSIGNIPTPYKDVSEYYQEKKELQSLLNKTTSGLRYLCTDLDRTDLKSLLFKAVRFEPIEDINLLIDSLKSEHNENWLKEIKKQLSKAPPQSIVADEVIKDHQLVFSETTNFHEYVGNKWIQKTDTDIKSYIDKALGNFTSNAMINSILGLIKARTNKEIEFNKKHLMNFKNGTLELDTGIFRSAKYSDYLTIEAEYDYDPNANCPIFQDYLIEVTDNHPDKITLLQEVLGYILFPENTLQKCAFFIGDGSNGKSVITDLLEDLFGKKSVTDIDVSSLNSEFQRIYLKDSMVNIAPDIKADMKGAEDYFKRVVTGDPINGCYKNRDFIQFKPHAKFIISANDFIKPNDTSYGMERRLLFVNFPISFVDNPILPHERKANKNLNKQLKEELPGIFNWLYIGYKRLMENQQFSETDEHRQLIKQFRTQINPVYEFCNEFLKNRSEFTTEEAYSEFLTTYGSRLSKRSFSMSLAKEIRKNFPLWIKENDGKRRGYKLNLQIH